MNILYVEDNKINAMVMNKMLSKNVSNVIIAENGPTALKIVKESSPDLILVDINLGLNQMDGCELLKRLKKLDILKNIPIYAVTAYAMPGDAQKFIKIGFDKYFSKPVNFEKLLSAISNVSS
ncbi:response regulator [Aquimarina sp. BL5]|uniref:response regulator n=2 Tax=Aquimarina TaxID=290174 RepID=UPI000E54BAF5|nr:response regulator [Aquimarina sp. BL5]AXT53786.1 response regulator [Aquimarina sp. BL5]RKN00534.1 response regulator [Aquimarina sp. BL5]